MKMAEQNPVSHLLDGMVLCQNCNTPMEPTDEPFTETPRYVCPRIWAGCDTPDIPAEPFNRRVFEAVIGAILEGGNAKRVAEEAREEVRHRIKEYTDVKEILETRPAPRTVMDVLAPRPPDLSNLDPEAYTLLELDEREYIETLRRVDRYWSVIGDTGQIEERALDPNTYLRPHSISYARDIIATAVGEVLVNVRSATIRYQTPMPPDTETEGKTQEEVELPT